MTNPQLIEVAELLMRLSNITQKGFLTIVDSLEDGGIFGGKDVDNIIDLATYRKLTP
jgi:hypothetical protein